MQNELSATKEENRWMFNVIWWMGISASFCVFTWIRYDFGAFLFVSMACFLGMLLGSSISTFSKIRERNHPNGE